MMTTLRPSPATERFLEEMRAARRGELHLGDDCAPLVRVLKAYQAEDEAQLAVFADSLLDERDALDFRKLSGEALSDAECARLAALDATLVPLLPKSDPMPADIIAAIEEARGLK
jgi:hypothetical protein